jgi:hypothetical protein
LGAVLTLDSLPSSHTKRWISRRKAEVVVAVNNGLLSMEQACERYALSDEEFLAWARSFKDFGLSGLQATQILTKGPARPVTSRRRPKPLPSDQSHTLV